MHVSHLITASQNPQALPFLTDSSQKVFLTESRSCNLLDSSLTSSIYGCSKGSSSKSENHSFGKNCKISMKRFNMTKVNLRYVTVQKFAFNGVYWRNLASEILVYNFNISACTFPATILCLRESFL